MHPCSPARTVLIACGLATTLLFGSAGTVAAQCFGPSNPVPAPVDWNLFATDGFTVSYTYQGQIIYDNETSSDPSNGGAAVSPAAVDIGSGGNPGGEPSALFGYYNGGTPWDPTDLSTMQDDFIYFRIRVVGDPTAKDGFVSYHWNVLFDLDADGYKEYWIDLEGSYTSSSGPDRLRVLYNNDNTQLVSNPDADSVVDLPAYNDGTNPASYTRAVQVTPGDPNSEWWIDLQVPMAALKDLNCNQELFPDSPVAFFYSTGSSNTDPLQKDHMMDGGFISASDPITFGDTIFPNGQTLVSPIDESFHSVSVFEIGGGEVYVLVNDRLANTDDTVVETLLVTVTDPVTGDSEQVLLTETSASSGIFSSTTTPDPLPTSSDPAVAGDGTLQVLDGDEIIVSYTNVGGTTVSSTAIMLGPCDAYIQFTRADGRPTQDFQLTTSSSTSDRLYVTVYYPDVNTNGTGNPAVVDTLTVALSGNDSQSITVTETGPNTGVFRNTTGLATQISDGTVTANDGLWEDIDGGAVHASLSYTCGGTTHSATADASLFYLATAARVFFVDSTGRYDVSVYTAGQPVYVKVTDPDVEVDSSGCGLDDGSPTCDGNASTTRTVTARITSPTGDYEDVTLYETAETTTGTCSHIFLSNGGVTTRTYDSSNGYTANDGILDIEDGQTITVTYNDCHDGDLDAGNDTKSDTALYNAPDVVIQEVQFIPDTTGCVNDTEYVTLLNNGTSDADVTGYTISDADGWTYTIPQWTGADLTLTPGQKLIILLFPGTPPSGNIYDWTDGAGVYYLMVDNGTSDQLDNHYDQVFLDNYVGTPVDYVGWSDTHTPSLDFLGDDTLAVLNPPAIWPDDAYVNENTVGSAPLVAGEAIYRSPSGTDTDVPGDWAAAPSTVCEQLVTLTPVVVSSLGASIVDGQVVVQWTTASEASTLGFDLYRGTEGGSRTELVNSGLLPAAIGSPQGASYRYVDAGAPLAGPISYTLVEETARGSQHVYGPFQVAPAPAVPGETLPADGYSFTAAAPSPGQQKRADAHRAEAAKAKAERKGRKGDALKIAVDDTGLYVVTAADIASELDLPRASVAQRIRSGQLELSAGGVQTAWYPLPDASGLVFYGQALDLPWARTNVYWLGRGKGLQMETDAGRGPGPVDGEETFPEQLHVEQDRVAVVMNEADPLGDVFFWGYLYPGHPSLGHLDMNVDAPGVAATAGTATAVVHLKGWNGVAASPDHHASLAVNGQVVGEVFFDGSADADLRATFPQPLLRAAGNTFRVIAVRDPGVSPTYFMVDSVDLSYERQLVAHDDTWSGRAGTTSIVTVPGFSAADVLAFDVSNPVRPVVLSAINIDSNGAGYRASFRPATASSTFALATHAALRTPTEIYADIPSDLHSPSRQADWLVIAPDELLDAAGRLAAVHEGEGLRTTVVSLEDVYDEFAAGVANPVAIPDFLAYAAAHWSHPPRYVVLAGSGTYDYRDVLGWGDNLIPALLTATPDGVYASDSMLGDVDGDGTPDITVGRVPVLTSDELDRYTARVAAHDAGVGSGGWRDRVVMTAGDPDRSLVDFAADSLHLEGFLPGSLDVDRVDEVSEGFPSARQHLFGDLADGALLVNYIGHGGADRLASKGLLTSADVPSLANADRLPVVTALTCAVGIFQIPGYNSLAEQLVLGEQGGALAVWAPTALSVNSEARILGEGFLSGAFEQSGGVRLGDAVEYAFRHYAASGHLGYLPKVYALFGDPAVELR